MIDWGAVRDADFAVPDGDVAELTAELASLLADPDPAVRDELAYPVLATWVERGVCDLLPLGDRMAESLAHPEIQARGFGALVLAEVVVADPGDSSAVRRWRDALVAWWPREPDLRGYDPELGWLHAAAHGADALAAFGRSSHLDDADLRGLLDAVAVRLLEPTDHVFAQQEDDRIAQAAYAVLARPELTEPVAWLDPIATEFADRPAGPTPVAHSNAMRTLRCLYLLADRTARLAPDGPPVPLPHRDAVRKAIADVLRHCWPFL